MQYDVIIIGGGPAGLTAALYAARTGMKTCVVSKWVGGNVNSIHLIENWPGYKGTGTMLMEKFYSHLKKFDVDFVVEEVSKIGKGKDFFTVTSKTKKIEGKTIIFATGKERKKLGIPGEEEFNGKGISYCTTCDAFFFKNKIVAMIAESGCESISILELAELAKKVYVFYKGKKFLDNEEIEKIEKKKNIEIFYETIPKEIKGKEKIESIIVNGNGKIREIPVEAVFIEIGCVSLKKVVKGLDVELDKNGYVIVNEEMKTSVPGLFAAGDVTNTRLKQVIVASSQGAIAAKAASEYLKK